MSGDNIAFGQVFTELPVEFVTAHDQRDYRKEMWIAAFCASALTTITCRTEFANQSLNSFDRRFSE